MNPNNLDQLTPAQQASYAAFMARIGTNTAPTIASQPAVVATAPVPAPPPISPSLAFRVAHWWDHSHQFRDTMRWIWARRPFQGKPPTPPAPPSGGSGSGGGEGELRASYIRLAAAIFVVLGSVAGWYLYSKSVESGNTPDGVARAKVQAGLMKDMLDASAPVDLLSACEKLAEKYSERNIPLPSMCTSGAPTSAPLSHKPSSANPPTGTCSSSKVDRGAGDVLLAFKGKTGCTVTLKAGQWLLLDGHFTVTNIEGAGEVQFVRKQCGSWRDLDREDVNLPQGSKSPTECTRVNFPSDINSGVATLTFSN